METWGRGMVPWWVRQGGPAGKDQVEGREMTTLEMRLPAEVVSRRVEVGLPS